jgi:hypothetical protein
MRYRAFILHKRKYITAHSDFILIDLFGHVTYQSSTVAIDCFVLKTVYSKTRRFTRLFALFRYKQNLIRNSSFPSFHIISYAERVMLFVSNTELSISEAIRL